MIWDFLEIQNKSSVTNIEKKDTHSIPINFKLYQNYPNPFNPSSVIKYQLMKSCNITLKIYNISGQEIETLVNEFQPAGEYIITWQPKGLTSGLYFYRIQTGDASTGSLRQGSGQAAQRFFETRKLVFQK